MESENCYQDEKRAEAYAALEFPGTYYLAYRDLPDIISRHVKGRKAIDFGCGTGRSTRFLKESGFDVVGVDIAEKMIAKAEEADPAGDYRRIGDGDLGQFAANAFDLGLSVFTFDNIPTMERKVASLKALRRLLTEGGRIVSLVSTPEIYTHEWASFSTAGFPENREAKSGDRVRIIMKDVADKRPVEDVLVSDADYRECFRRAGLELTATYKPLADGSEPFTWVSETRIPPWAVHVLKCGKSRTS